MMNNDEMLELARWCIDRIDNLRASAANRAALVVSADALLLTGTTFLLDKAMQTNAPPGSSGRVLFIICATACLIFLSLSLIFAANATIFVWSDTRKAVGLRVLPPILFFNTRSTSSFDNAEDIQMKFRATSIEQMIDMALGELLLASKAHQLRYARLRGSLRLLFVAFIPLAASIVLWLRGIV